MEKSFDSEEKMERGLAEKSKNKTPMLDSFGRDLNELARKGKLDPVIGRDAEIEKMSQILNKRKKNSVLIIGASGVGKTCLAEGLAMKIVSRDVDKSMWGKKIVELNMSSVVAGTKYRGEFESRMKDLVEELRANQDVIIFLDEIHNVIGAGSAAGGMDASNILKPALARGEISCIGATTFDDFKKSMESDTAFDRRFQRLKIEEPTKEETINVLKSIKSKYEKHHRTRYSDEIIERIVTLCERYIPYRNFPDKAIDIMDEVGSLSKLSKVKPNDIIRDLRKEIAIIVEKKRRAAEEQRYEDAKALKDMEINLKSQIDVQFELIEKDSFMDDSPISAKQVDSIISNHSGIPVSEIGTEDSDVVMEMDKILSSKVIGQDHAVSIITKAIKRSRAGVQDPNKPFVMLFLGKTGTGKTHLAKELTKLLFHSEKSMIRLDMSEFMEASSVSKLIGAPPGFVGYNEKGFLTEKVKNNPYSLILIDEVEKAHRTVVNVFLQMFDEGKLTDNTGIEVNFKNCIIIMTSNIGTEALMNNSFSGFISTTNSEIDVEKKIDKELRGFFRPELINRIDEKIIFNSLSQNDIKKIASLELSKLEDRLSIKGISITFSNKLIEYVADNGYSNDYGARPIKRLIASEIETPVADVILSHKIGPNRTIRVDYKKEKVVVNHD